MAASNSGAYNITGGAGNDTLTGAQGVDTFNVGGGTDSITDLSSNDVLIVGSGATANASNISSFTANSKQSTRILILPH